MRKITLRMCSQYICRKYRQKTGDCHRYGLPYGACAIKRKLQYLDKYHCQEVNMSVKRIKLIQILLERRYPVYLYDKSARDSSFRLRADRAIYYLNKLEGSIENE